MEGIYRYPLRVYLVLAVCAALGIWSFFRMPISLFPNSSKPVVSVSFGFGGMSAEEFRFRFGDEIEQSFRTMKSNGVKAEKVKVWYRMRSMDVEIDYNWGADPETAKREADLLARSIASTFPDEMKRSVEVYIPGQEILLAIAFHSDRRSLEELYGLLKPILLPSIQGIADAQEIELMNPEQKEIKVVLKPEQILGLGLSPKAVENAVQQKLFGQQAGSLGKGSHALNLFRPKGVMSIDDLKELPIATPSGVITPLKNVADISMQLASLSQRLGKTDGMRSLILIIKPKQGGNIKRMSQEAFRRIQSISSALPTDVKQRVIVDPSESITSSIKHVAFEVALGSVLASAILFLLIGSLRNVVTAAIEIPLSMVLAFIFMSSCGVNINLFSLAGFALAAGMNVDASVVVMDHIMRRIQQARAEHKTFNPMDIIISAVNDVRMPLIASTAASLAVFTPFLALDGLGFAILGDLVKCVIISHSFSLVIALILVPTVRLHMLRDSVEMEEKKAPAERFLLGIERQYMRVLQSFIQQPRMFHCFLAFLLILLGLSLAIVPKIPKEIVSKPLSEWLVVSLEASGNTNVREMEALAEPIENRVRHILGKDINYIFTWVQGVDNTSILIRLHDKDHLESAMESLKQGLGQDARLTINVDQWTFSEFKVPSPPDWQISISGSDQNDRASLAKEISDRLTSRRLIASHELVPNFSSRKVLSLSPREGVWSGLQHEGFQFSPASLVDELRVMYQGKWIGDLLIGQQSMPMVLSYPEAFSQKLADLKALPVWVGSSLVPFEALMDVSIKPPAQTLFKEDGRDLARVEVRLEKNEGEEQRFLEGAQRIIQEVTKERAATGNPAVSIGIEKPNPEYQDSMFNLALAMVGSILLMAVIVILQFGSLRDSLLVLTAVPTGLMGAILSLYCFNSILSLNAILGMTLLNGISINNSIMLVDYARKSLRSGEAAFSAIIHAASTRLRPILITTITTVLGMTPLALGFGEGGKVLQPLSLAVVGGLWISTAVTIIIIPVVFAKFGETRTYDKA